VAGAEPEGNVSDRPRRLVTRAMIPAACNGNSSGHNVTSSNTDWLVHLNQPLLEMGFADLALSNERYESKQ